MDPNILKKQVVPGEGFDWDNTFVPLYGRGWRQPQSITLKNLASSIEISVNEEHFLDKIDERANSIMENMVNSITVGDIEEKPTAPPGTQLQKSYIAVDDNYLYVWVGNRWKRTILSEW